MAVITSYPDDTSLTDSDRLLGVDSGGTTKLTTLLSLKRYALSTGWVSADDAWTYSSYSSTTKIGVINTNSGANTKYSVGQKLMFTQPTLGTKYATITAITTTTITALFNGTTVLSNEAITAPNYSSADTPFGFPHEFVAVTPTLTNITLGNGTIAAYLAVQGKKAQMYGKITSGTTTSFATDARISLPINASSRVADRKPMGTYNLYDSSATANIIGDLIKYPSAQTAWLQFRLIPGSPAYLSSTGGFPVVSAAGDEITFDMEWEIA